MYNLYDVVSVANKLGIKFDRFTPEEFLTGINIETEHGLIDPSTNVTDNNLEKTAKIALAHLNEYPNYYNKEYGLLKFEEMLRKRLKSA